MYINHIAEGMTSQMRMFADDSIVYRQIYTPADHFTLVSDLNKFLYWAKTWQMDFNVSKCAVLSVTTKRNISAYDYFMRSQQIPWTDNQLGLPGGYHQHKTIVAPTQPHINKVQNKASKTLGLLKRTLRAAQPQVRHGTRGTRAANARDCHMRLGTSRKDRHSNNRARTKIRCAVSHR